MYTCLLIDSVLTPTNPFHVFAPKNTLRACAPARLLMPRTPSWCSQSDGACLKRRVVSQRLLREHQEGIPLCERPDGVRWHEYKNTKKNKLMNSQKIQNINYTIDIYI